MYSSDPRLTLPLGPTRLCVIFVHMIALQYLGVIFLLAKVFKFDLGTHFSPLTVLCYFFIGSAITHGLT